MFMANYSKNFINFDTKVDETVRYQCRSEDLSMISDKEIFRIDNSFYFYLYNRNGKNSTYSLREITKSEYLHRKDEFFSLRPNGRFGRFSKDGMNYFIACYTNNCYWKKNMPLKDCIFINPSPLKDVYDAVVTEIEMRDRQSKEREELSRQEYARICGRLSLELGVSFVNVMRIGVDREKLIIFKNSYEEAMKKIRFMSLPKLRELQLNLIRVGKNRFGRDKRKRALKDLGVEFFDADVVMMDFKELEELIDKPLEKYGSDSLELAIENAVNLPYDERKEIFDMFLNASRATKRAILQRLGVDVAAIDFSCYPISRIKHALQSSLGLDLY